MKIEKREQLHVETMYLLELNSSNVGLSLLFWDRDTCDNNMSNIITDGYL